MKALVWEAARLMNMREQEKPTPASEDVILKVAYGGICGSELSGYLGHNALRKPPLVMGHEFSGVIDQLGEAVAQKYPHLSIGQTVTVNPVVPCGACEYCAQGLEQVCPKRTFVGIGRPGAYAEFVLAPASRVHPLPIDMDARIGALTEPAAVAVRVANLIGAMHGEIVFIAGAGPIGLLILQMMQVRGAQKVFISDLNADRQAMADALGGVVLNPAQVDVVQHIREATGGRGAFATVDAVGVAATRKHCVSAIRSAGTMILSGLHEETGMMPAAEIIRREIVVRGSFAYTSADFSEALHLLAQHKLRLDPWIVEAPLADGGHWFERLVEGDGTVAKVLLTPAL